MFDYVSSGSMTRRLLLGCLRLGRSSWLAAGEDHRIAAVLHEGIETLQQMMWWCNQRGMDTNWWAVPMLSCQLLEINIYKWVTRQNLRFSPFAGGAFFIEMTRVATAFSTNDISLNRYLGRGHFPLCLSSSLNFLRTSSKRCSRAVIANWPATPPSLFVSWMLVPSLFALSSKRENCSSVSKQVLANSSRNFISVSQPGLAAVAEWIDPLFNKTTTFRMKWWGISPE